jgi:alpha-soluble NSF attachment protein
MAGGTSNKSAAQLMTEANKKAKSANGFFQRMLGAGSGVSDDARALYVQAGNAAKAESDYPTSVEAYKRALDLSSEDFEKAQMYEAIASSYKMFDLPHAVPPLTRAAELHMSQGKWTMASQTLEKVAELYEQMNDLDNMMKCLKEAHRFLKQEGQKAGANRVQKKMAEILALQHEFMRAQQEYEEMADKTKDDAMLKYGAKDFWLRATMCALCIDVENANTALTRYLNDNPLFEERSLEVKLLRQLIAAVEEQNKELFLKHIDETPLSTLRADRVFRSLTEDIGKRINGDVDLK